VDVFDEPKQFLKSTLFNYQKNQNKNYIGSNPEIDEYVQIKKS